MVNRPPLTSFGHRRLRELADWSEGRPARTRGTDPSCQNYEAQISGTPHPTLC